ncbi:ABC transporter substrate-binding protein [Natrarchaeobius chitinivorans]|uniref:ABC transporter substrate-binding protein n=1 Tax=Natrarchaeobius chitinivorans TaxID=1679083 RepID=UPI000F5397D2|nr:ABC transporter substrate-binding protein [Natrarchaeobius chitinivorans]
MPTRREYVSGVGAITAVAIAGCSDDGGNGNGNGDTDADTGNGDASGEDLEIMIAWTGEDGGQGFENLHEGFQEEYPDVETVVNDNPGGAGTGLQTALDTRMFDNDPPGTWGFFPGPDLTDYAEGGLLGDVSEEVWEEEGLEEPIPEYLSDLCYFDEIGYVAVPIEFNRLNNLFYNVEIVEEAGVDPEAIETPSDLTDAMAQVESETDAVGIAQSTQEPWTVLQLWETVLLGEYDFETYTSYIDGEIESIEDEVRDTLEIVVDYTDYNNPDAGSVDFTEATSQFIGEEAAFLHDGQWAVGNFTRADDYEYDEDWHAVAYPGSEDVFMGQCSAFMYPADNPAPEAAINWLRYTGTNDAQIRFNSAKGGIPCRDDAPIDDDEWEFSEHQQVMYDDFLEADNLTGTISHNNVTLPQISTNVYDVFSAFSGTWDVDDTYEGLVDAFDI